jgi:hypothetical protein
VAVVAHSILTYDELLAALDVTAPSVTEKKAALEALCKSITISVEREFKRRIVWRPSNGTDDFFTEYHTLREPAPVLYLCERPVFSTPAIEIVESSTRAYSTTTPLVNGTDYVVTLSNGKVERLSNGMSAELFAAQRTWWPSSASHPYGGGFGGPSFALGVRAIRVKYKAGFADTASVPEHIKDWTGRLAVIKWREVTRHVQGINSWADEEGNFTRVGVVKIPQEFKDELRSEYRYLESRTAERDFY